MSIAYVSVAGERRVLVLELHDDTGALVTIESVEVPGPDTDAPISMPLAVSPDRRFLYAAIRTPPYPVSSFAIDPLTGQLAHRGISELPDAMAYIVTDRTGHFLLSASYTGSMLAVNAIDVGGGITAAPVQVILAAPRAHCILPDAHNRFVYAAILGANAILYRSFDSATGKLSPAASQGMQAKVAAPRHIVLHPNSRWLYAINELDATIDYLGVDAQTGALEPKQTVRLLPGGFVGRPSAADLHITPDGRFLYGSERTTSVLVGFAVDPTNGMLTAAASASTEPSPRGFNIDPRGRFLLCAGQGSGRVSVYAIEAANGHLDRIGTCPVGRNPNWIEIIDLPRIADSE
jgi:6-phosphogluconolactonase